MWKNTFSILKECKWQHNCLLKFYFVFVNFKEQQRMKMCTIIKCFILLPI